MASDQLFNALQAVDGEASFIRFVELLAMERESTDQLPLTVDGFQGPWANRTITDFLRAGTAWAEDTEFGVRPGPKPTNPWRLFATFLWAGRGYE